MLIDKPRGITSFDVIRVLKGRYGRLRVGHVRNLKIGHAGTLDPLATGLLIVGVGKGTKRLNEFLKLPKTYEAHVLLGTKTATGDMEGKILEKKEVLYVDPKLVRETIKNLVGEIILPVPVYSAKKEKGTPLYARVRRGEDIEPPKRKMKIFRLDLLGIIKREKEITLFVEMEVGSGVYVRSIAEEIGRRLHMPATLENLRRTKIGDFNVRDARMLKNT